MKILIAEDDFTVRKVMQKILAPFGECEFAVNGEEALFAFSTACSDKTPYDLIFLDIHMPQLSGLDVLKKIREQEESIGIAGLNGVKIVMATGSDDAAAVLTSFRSGCEAYIVKPVEREKVYTTLRRIGVELPSSSPS